MKSILGNALMLVPIFLLIMFSIRHNGREDTWKGLKLVGGIVLGIASLYLGYEILK